MDPVTFDLTGGGLAALLAKWLWPFARISGFVMASVEPYWEVDPKRGRRYVTDWAFYSERFGSGRKMLKIMVDWAWTMPRVIEVKVGTQIPQSDELMDRLFISAGFERVGRMYRCHKPQGEG